MVPRGIPHSEFLSWSEDDQDKALAFMRRERERCDKCGTKRSEWQENHFAYISDAFQCPGCEAIEQELENVPDDVKGAKVFLVKNVKGVQTSPGFGSAVMPEEAFDPAPPEGGLFT